MSATPAPRRVAPNRAARRGSRAQTTAGFDVAALDDHDARGQIDRAVSRRDRLTLTHFATAIPDFARHTDTRRRDRVAYAAATRYVRAALAATGDTDPAAVDVARIARALHAVADRSTGPAADSSATPPAAGPTTPAALFVCALTIAPGAPNHAALSAA